MPTNPLEPDVAATLRALRASSRSETEKLSLAFHHLTGLLIRDAERQIELCAALGDDEGKVKQQIKMETMKTARQIFRTCHLQITGKEPPHDPDVR